MLSGRRFSDLTIKELVNRINQLGLNISSISEMFIFIGEFDKKPLSFKQRYQGTDSGFTISLDEAQQKEKTTNTVRNSLAEKQIHGTYYPRDRTISTFKYHISLNNIGSVSAETISELCEFLNTLSTTSNLDASFRFKIITPDLCNHARFKDNDQITIYFDKYSSLEATLVLSEEINQFLTKKNIFPNIKNLGYKDVISFNSFVSARIDTNLLLDEYGIYIFFDKELDKFLSSYKENRQALLKDMPLCLIDAVFINTLIKFSDYLPKSGESFSETHSRLIQEEFESARKLGMEYLRASESMQSYQSKYHEVLDTIDQNSIDLIPIRHQLKILNDILVKIHRDILTSDEDLDPQMLHNYYLSARVGSAIAPDLNEFVYDLIHAPNNNNRDIIIAEFNAYLLNLRNTYGMERSTYKVILSINKLKSIINQRDPVLAKKKAPSPLVSGSLHKPAQKHPANKQPIHPKTTPRGGQSK